jgi:hypothetical protein
MPTHGRTFNSRLFVNQQKDQKVVTDKQKAYKSEYCLQEMSKEQLITLINMQKQEPISVKMLHNNSCLNGFDNLNKVGSFINILGMGYYQGSKSKPNVSVIYPYVNVTSDYSVKESFFPKISFSDSFEQQSNKIEFSLLQAERKINELQLLIDVMINEFKQYKTINNKNSHLENVPIVKYASGNKRWYLNGKLHREDGPAIEDADGYKGWYLNDQLHRTDGPAVEHINGDKVWYVDDKLHRTDGPAIERADGTKEWWVNGKRHRIDGPAVEDVHGYKAWYLNGKYHREDGPAIEWVDGSKAWWVDGKLHRTDGPAIEYAHGYKAWYLDGRYHRTDGPAVEDVNGYKAWYLDGQLHHTDGPAIERANGGKEYWLHGVEQDPPG